MAKAINVISAAEAAREKHLKEVALEQGRAAVHIEAKRTEDRSDLIETQKEFREIALGVRAYIRKNCKDLIEEHPFIKDFHAAFGPEIRVVKTYAKKTQDQFLKDELLDLLYTEAAMRYHARALDVQDPLSWKQCWPECYPDVEDPIKIDLEAELKRYPELAD